MRIVTVFILFLVTGQIYAGSSAYQEGREAASEGNHDQAYTIFLNAAEQGDAWSQFGLGVLSLSGEGISKDIGDSTHWFQKAAAQGHSFAQFNLGNAYLHGRGVERDRVQAAFWWQKAAEQNNLSAQDNLGTLMYFDFATETSKRLGVAWLTVAADKGNETARRRLEKINASDDNKSNSIWYSDPELSEVKILTMPSKYYSVNIFAAKQQKSITDFIHKNALKGKIYIYRFQRDDSFLYGILYGNYSSKVAAKKTIKNIRPELRKHGPWPVSFNAIKSKIRAVQTQQLEQKSP